jgi:hypothetical protein
MVQPAGVAEVGQLLIADWIEGLSSVVPSPFAPYALTSIHGTGPAICTPFDWADVGLATDRSSRAMANRSARFTEKRGRTTTAIVALLLSTCILRRNWNLKGGKGAHPAHPVRRTILPLGGGAVKMKDSAYRSTQRIATALSVNITARRSHARAERAE